MEVHVSDQDMQDPELLAQLHSLGWHEGAAQHPPPPPEGLARGFPGADGQEEAPDATALRARAQQLRREAVALKRANQMAEARSALKVRCAERAACTHRPAVHAMSRLVGPACSLLNLVALAFAPLSDFAVSYDIQNFTRGRLLFYCGREQHDAANDLPRGCRHPSTSPTRAWIYTTLSYLLQVLRSLWLSGWLGTVTWRVGNRRAVPGADRARSHRFAGRCGDCRRQSSWTTRRNK